MPLSSVHIVPYGESALLLYYGSQKTVDGFDLGRVKFLQTLAKNLRQDEAWDEVVPAYDSLLLCFNPAQLTYQMAKSQVELAIEECNPMDLKGKCHRIPVCYGGAFGPDMGHIQARSGLSEDAIVALHSAPTYYVCMMGFIPGFLFLSPAPHALHHPRHKTPRLQVPAGSVGIANWQTGIYGLESPGGWQIIGRTPVETFSAWRKPSFLIEAGDEIQFIPSGADIFSELFPGDSE